jgi:uncharacterized protein (DUF1697 family)
MPVYVGLLRAVNVGGAAPLGMTALVDALRDGGFENVRTWLQSGNVIFRSGSSDSSRLEEKLEARLRNRFGLTTDVFVRSASEWKSLVDQNPFVREAEADPAHLVVAVLKQAPSSEQWGALQTAIRGRERVHPAGRHAYVVYPDGIGRSRLTPSLLERKIGTRATSRNWNTVRKLDQLAST